MGYWLRKRSALFIVLGLLAGLMGGCGEKSSSTQSTGGGVGGGSVLPSSDTPLAEAAQQIVIDNFSFRPPTLTIPVGTKVTWINHDDVPHTATSTAKPKHFESGTLDTDDRYSHVFTTVGTYPYFCAVHPKMTGQIIVK
ncbi:MAG TPA: cupredoxin family copper-binding protein [Gemmataceae bacterium]|nr:cupredoxin family copper-binding protein [Gemmataceae bacterium]